MYNPTFSVAGMNASANNHHGGPNWGNPGAGGFADSLNPPRGHYQAGIHLSASQNSPQGNQRTDDVPVVPTKAKLSRGPTADFGMSSMFESSRKRQTIADEDAPPTNSVNDIPTELHFDSPPQRHARTPSTPQNNQASYIVVFGYPPDKYSQTVEYFKSLGDSTEADNHTEVMNCFRIGYNDPGDALRAVRKNGEILGGSWMVGAKWADPAQAEVMLGQPITPRAIEPAASPQNAMAVDEPSSHLPSPRMTVGTPLKLAPSSSAFRRPGSEKATPVRLAAGGTPVAMQTTPVQSSPSKGVLGQVSDLIFGW
ncbi:hypothetical protein PLEOSDRAFT_1077336 [Pleurotus ostreatus PC15]|uniref:RRM Nup35-type domain-containing protein n=1 Tax=Pleurotus ostreatus (strain PC15) TaxID=1137138 RepID=A0A067NRV0_PLEO1|nr:hypothetical protein PLEOSDRAFT_1077336 [Pleurotus ostreatus PC15]